MMRPSSATTRGTAGAGSACSSGASSTEAPRRATSRTRRRTARSSRASRPPTATSATRCAARAGRAKRRRRSGARSSSIRATSGAGWRSPTCCSGEGRTADAEAASTCPRRRRRCCCGGSRPRSRAQGDARARRASASCSLAKGADDDLRRRGRDAFVEAKATAELRAAFDKALARARPARRGGLAGDGVAGLRTRTGAAATRSWRASPGRPSLQLAALAGYVRALRTHGNTRRLVRLTKEQRTALRSDDFLWGIAGHALSLVDDRATVDWMQDWPKRKSSPWALNGLAISLRQLGAREEAVRVSRRALQLPADHIAPCHRAWVGIEAALDGTLEEAESLLAGLEPPAESKAFYDALALLARAAIVMRRSGRGRATPRRAGCSRNRPSSPAPATATWRPCGGARSTLWSASIGASPHSSGASWERPDVRVSAACNHRASASVSSPRGGSHAFKPLDARGMGRAGRGAVAGGGHARRRGRRLVPGGQRRLARVAHATARSARRRSPRAARWRWTPARTAASRCAAGIGTRFACA